MNIENDSANVPAREEVQAPATAPVFSDPPAVFSVSAFRKMLGMSAPLMLSHLTNMLGGFANVYLFSRLGAKSLAAAGLITATQNLFVASVGGSLFGCSVLMAEELSQRNQAPRNIGILWRQIQLLTLAYDVLVIPLYLTTDFILSNLGQDDTLLPHVQSYFNYYGIGFAANLLSLGNQQVLLSHENTLPILLINTVNNLSNFGLGYGLITQKNIWQESAVSIAYGISSWASLLLSSVYINLKYRQNGLLSFKLSPFLTNLRKLLRKGLPIGLQNGAEVIALWVSMLMAGEFGDASLTAAEIAGQYVYILTVPGFALGQVTMVLSAQQYTRKDYAELRRVGIRAMLLSQVLPACGMLLFLTIPRQLTLFFLDNNAQADDILAATQRLLLINGIGQFSDGVRQTLTGALIGQGDNVYPMVTNIMSMCLIGILSSYLMGFLGDEGVDGIFAGRSISMFLAAILLAIRWLRTTSHLIATPLQDTLTGSREVLLADSDGEEEPVEFIFEINSTPASSNASFFQRTPLARSHSLPECGTDNIETNDNVSLLCPSI
jgi:MATE family multidrug resistance protein